MTSGSRVQRLRRGPEALACATRVRRGARGDVWCEPVAHRPAELIRHLRTSVRHAQVARRIFSRSVAESHTSMVTRTPDKSLPKTVVVRESDSSAGGNRRRPSAGAVLDRFVPGLALPCSLSRVRKDLAAKSARPRSFGLIP